MTQSAPAPTQTDTLYCTFHPKRETLLRCNNCNRPICMSCAIHTPTGYRCKECVRGQQRTFNTATPVDLVLGAVVAGALSLVGSLIVGRLGFFTLFLAPIAGVIIAEAVRKVVSKRRSKLLWQLTAGAILLGALILPLMSLVNGFGFSAFSLIRLLWPVAYALIATSTAYYRLSGIQMR